MTVKILIKRNIPNETQKELMPLLRLLRNLGMNQPGYISGETLKNVEDTEEVLVISTWQSASQWQAWMENQQRIELQNQIDLISQSETDYKIYSY